MIIFSRFTFFFFKTFNQASHFNVYPQEALWLDPLQHACTLNCTTSEAGQTASCTFTMIHTLTFASVKASRFSSHLETMRKPSALQTSFGTHTWGLEPIQANFLHNNNVLCNHFPQILVVACGEIGRQSGRVKLD